MNIIIPLAGNGKRFKEDGYAMPKPLIMVHGEPLIFHVLRKLGGIHNSVFIVYNKSLDAYGFNMLVAREFPKVILIPISFPTRGAVETVLCGLGKMKYLDEPTLVLDGDTFYESNIHEKDVGGNAVFYFETENEPPIYSYIDIRNDGTIRNIEEKEKISDFACSGAYQFSSGTVLRQYCEMVLLEENKSLGEYYMSNVIWKMLEKGMVVNAISCGEFHCLGTPQQLKSYCIKEDIIGKKRRFCFDLDGTLATLPALGGDYSTIRPIERNVTRLRYLYSLGHTIIIETARGNKSGDNKTGKSHREVLSFLLEYEIPYDEIYFCKPHADFYIDDLGVSAYSDVDKAIGFYNGSTEARHFNKVKFVDGWNVLKTTANQGEVYWYNNIPPAIKEHFPKVVNVDGNEILMERVNGISLSYLHINGSMIKPDLLLLFETMRKIHCGITDIQSIPVYANYGQKLLQRYTNYDYSFLGIAQYVYDKLQHKLMDYADKDLAQIGVIHGDTVFSNIFLCDHRLLKFIDMRGKLGDTLTIYGDIFYDYAKVYQSLIGYDYILAGKENDLSKYNLDLLEYFSDLFIKKFGLPMFDYLKILTASLLFSLIPLHTDKNKQKLYFQLCQSLI